MSSKEYVYVTERFIRGKPRYFITDRRTIKCIGGENLAKVEPEMVFVNSKKIPKLRRGKAGRNWKAIFEKIPVGKAWVVPKEFGSGANIRQQVKNVNEELEKEVYKVTERTDKDTEVKTVYVKRLI